MSDELERIKALVDEEHAMRNAGPVDPDRLAHIEVLLDQCWDLLRQRDAKREFKQDQQAAHVRDASTVEGYQQ
ncbi:MAG: hypothetical protein JWM12_2647 [Ilumatobacteraceae bacterium]|nr:hypothetical protein [Ilumatobacteraceae bacterium]